MIRLGVIGYGRRISDVITSPLRKVEPDIRVVGIVDPDEKGVRSRLAKCDQKDVRFYKNLKEMVNKAGLDALAIGTCCHLHAPYAIEAAEYDIPLYLEKPVATSMKQAIALENAFEKSKCEVVVSFPLRVSPLCTLVHQYIAKCSIGHPEHIQAINYVPYGTVYFDTAGYRNYKITQGLFLQKATHDFDYMSYLMGANIVKVAAMYTRGRIFGGKKRAGLVCSKCNEQDTCLESPRNRKRNQSGGALSNYFCPFSIDCGSPEKGMNEDSSSALLEFDSGVHGVYTQVFYTRRDAGTRGAIISGYHGTISFDWYTNKMRYVQHHAPATITDKPGAGASHFGGDIELADDFINIIRGKGKSRTTIWAGIQSVYACLAAKKSAELGRFIKVRQVGQQC